MNLWIIRCRVVLWVHIFWHIVDANTFWLCTWKLSMAASPNELFMSLIDKLMIQQIQNSSAISVWKVVLAHLAPVKGCIWAKFWGQHERFETHIVNAVPRCTVYAHFSGSSRQFSLGGLNWPCSWIRKTALCMLRRPTRGQCVDPI